MLLYQGVQQFELWTGEKAPVELMREVLAEKFSVWCEPTVLNSHENRRQASIVLGEKIVIATGEELTSFEKTIILNPHDKLILDVKNLDTAKDKITAVHYAIFGAKKI